MMQVDLEVDSNNNGSIEGTNSAEDDAENQAGATGKIFGVNDGDRNINGVTDMLEVGYSQDFTPIELELRTKVPLEDLAVRFLYNGAALQTEPLPMCWTAKRHC